jgi:hypothetical protein
MIVRSTLAVALAAALLASPDAQAQTQTPVNSPKIIISNGAGAGKAVEVPLQDTGSEAAVQFLSNGDLQVSCRLNNDACPNVGSGGAGAALTFTRTPSGAEVNSGVSNLRLDWSSTGSQVCYASGPASVANWNGVPLANAGSRSLTAQVTQDTTMDFGIRCFTEAGGVSEGSTSVLVKAGSTGGTGDPFCQEYYPDGSTDPAFTAYGMLNKVEVAWTDVFGSQPGQPSTAGSGGRVGVPGFFLPTSNGNYLAIPFTLTSATDPVLRSMKIVWAEASGADGIETGAIVLSVSPCPGDFRTRSGFLNPEDSYISGVCGGRGTQNSGITIAASDSGIGGCPVPVGKQMYLNITTYDISSTAQPTVNACGEGGGLCGVRMRVEE